MKFFRFKTKYENCEAYIVERTYANNRVMHLTVHHAETGEPLCVATTNVPGYRPAENHVLIKDWSENEGVFNALYSAGIISTVQRYVKTGFVKAYECEYYGLK